MGRDLIQLANMAGGNNKQIRLALQCGPFFMGLRMATLYIEMKENKIWTQQLLKSLKVQAIILYENENKIIFLIYHKQALAPYLKQENIQKLLTQYGYQNMTFEAMLNGLADRYKKYKKTKQNFPHEIGIFLGYPYEDVIGFIENKGKNFLYEGYWKVYSHLSQCLIWFKQYDEAREQAVKLTAMGIELKEIMKRWPNTQNKQQVI